MMFTIDRLEGSLAVLEGEDGAMSTRPLETLPAGVRENDVLEWDGKNWSLRPDLRRARLEQNRARLEQLRRRKRS